MTGTNEQPRSTDPWLGRVLGGDFKILKPLGMGGFGAVYVAEQTSVSREVVVKVIRRALTEDPVVVRRFQREARAVARMSHPNVVQVLTAGETEDGAYYLVMEYIRGETLADVIKAGPVPEVRALRIAEQIAAALQAAHDVGIVHRDLKPANVMVSTLPGGGDLVKVLDFGIAKLRDSHDGDTSGLTADGALIGTPAYMSPEQVSGLEVDGRSDLYTLGLMLYEMVTGQHPFDAATPVQFILQHLNQPFTPPRVRAPNVRLAPELERILEQCLEKSPTDRFASAQLLKTALAQLADGIATGAYPATHPPTKKVITGARVAFLVAIAVFGLAMAGVVFIAIPQVIHASRDETEAPPRDRLARERAIPNLTDNEKPEPPPTVARARQTAPPALIDKPPTAQQQQQPATPPRPPTPAAAPELTWSNTGPSGAPLPSGARLGMNTDTLITYTVPHEISAIAPYFERHYERTRGVLFNMDDVDNPVEPSFAIILSNATEGVHMISAAHDGPGRSRLNYFVR